MIEEDLYYPSPGLWPPSPTGGEGNSGLRYVWSSALALIIFLFSQTAVAEFSDHYNSQLQHMKQQIVFLEDQQLSLQKKLHHLIKEREQFNQKPSLKYAEVVTLRQQIGMQANMAQIQVDDWNESLNNTQQRIVQLTNVEKALQVQFINEPLAEEKKIVTKKLNDVGKLITRYQEESVLLSNNLGLAQQISEVYQLYLKDCSMHMEAMNKRQMIQSLQSQVLEEQKLMDQWYEKMSELNKEEVQKTKDTSQVSDQMIKEGYLFYYNQQVHLSGVKIVLLELTINQRKMLEAFEDLNANRNNIKTNVLKATLEDETHTLQEALDTLTQASQLIKKQQELLQNALNNHWVDATKAYVLKQKIQQLENVVHQREKELSQEQKTIQTMQKKLEAYMVQLVAKRQVILKTDEELASGFFIQLLELPKRILTYGLGLWEQVWHKLTISGMGIRLFAGGTLAFMGIFWWAGRKYFYLLSCKMLPNRHRTTSNMTYILSELFRRNLGSLSLFLGGWSILYMTEINFSAYLGLLYTAMIWLSFRVIMGIARIVLVEREDNVQKHDIVLYHRLKWVFIIGGWATVLVVLSRQFEMSGVVFDISNRLFMAFLFTVSIVLFRGREVVPRLLRPLSVGRKYLSRTIRTIFWLLPIGLFISTSLGLLGYINLAWVLIYYQAALVLVIAGYIILRGVAVDLFEIISEGMIRRLSQGWLWSEAFLKPIDKLFRLFLFVLMIMCVFFVLGWRDDSLVVVKLREGMNYPFFYFSGINVTLWSIIEFIALVCFFFWLAKWTREFSYRWLFRNSKDIGIRNSLAVFCQYMVITVGTIITLRILGIDITGLSMILGGLAVGLGFGLRDLANNIVGGLMLLIERSVKEGDVVSIDNYEGEVTHIGIRAMRIRSWDHMEIMVPNSEILMKTFINWTHQNSIVRTVIPMKIHRVDDFPLVQNMILDLLKNAPEILAEPEPEVFYTELKESLVDVEVRYFIDISMHSRPAVRSKVVLMILKAFKEAGMRPPYTQQDSYVWSFSSSPLVGE